MARRRTLCAAVADSATRRPEHACASWVTTAATARYAPCSDAVDIEQSHPHGRVTWAPCLTADTPPRPPPPAWAPPSRARNRALAAALPHGRALVGLDSLAQTVRSVRMYDGLMRHGLMHLPQANVPRAQRGSTNRTTRTPRISWPSVPIRASVTPLLVCVPVKVAGRAPPAIAVRGIGYKAPHPRSRIVVDCQASCSGHGSCLTLMDYVAFGTTNGEPRYVYGACVRPNNSMSTG